MTDETLLRTPLYPLHKQLGARLVPFAGWEMPVQYKGVSQEHIAVRTAVGLFDVSHMGELMLTGANAAELVDSLITNDLSRIGDGQAQYTCACNERGTILDDLIVYKYSKTNILVVCNASNRDKMSSHFEVEARGRCNFSDISDETALLAVQGPRAVELVSRLKPSLDLAQVKPFHVVRASLLDIPCTLARTGYTGEDGFEIFCPWDSAPQIWSALLEEGARLGVEAVGLGARDTLRLEARLSLYGNEIDESTNPIEAGLGWVVKTAGRDFLGKEALEQVEREGIRRRIVGFEMLGRGIARHGYPLHDSSGQKVGLCTSGSPSPTLGKNIGLGYLPLELSEVGTRFQVDCRGKLIEAVVVKTPFYKRAKPG